MKHTDLIMSGPGGSDHDGAKAVSPEIGDIVPQLSSHDITFGELQTAIRVLTAVAALNNRKKAKRKAPDDVSDLTAAKESSLNGGTDSEQHASQRTQAEDQPDGLASYKHTNLRHFRKQLAACIELHQKTMYEGLDEDTYFEQRKQERSLKRQKMAERDLQKKHIASTVLRQGRVERLQALQNDAQHEEEAKIKALLVPDGSVATTGLLLENSTSNSDNGNSQHDEAATPPLEPSQVKLPKPRSCYVCKVRFRELHHFYDQLCPSCAALNWEKRHQSVSLRGKVAVVTGSRVKIGFQVCLKLLRAGCIVVATTRFPNSAVDAYRQEGDFDSWKERLHVFGLDLRDVTGLEAFTRFLKVQFGDRGLDILINNACQTVRRPAGYYLPLVGQEQALWERADETHRSVLGGCIEFERLRRRILLDHKTQQHGYSNHLLPLEASSTSPSIMPPDINGNMQAGESRIETTSTMVRASTENRQDCQPTEISTPFESSGLSHSAAMSQMIILPEDAGVSDSILPPGMSDINGQQLDLRSTNSWLLKLEEVSTPEILECMFVNAIAPFVLNSRLKPLMTVPEDDPSRPDRYIINVSAMEGKFYRYKMPNHPHTNMAKAALNMLTRTSAEDLAKNHRIFMNSVDTGWINDENPLEKAHKIAKTNLFQTPIDEIDAAARIVDPILTGVQLDEERAINPSLPANKDFGKFLKDYRESEW